MARSWLIPHWRRIVMQLTLWGVFAASLGVAVLVAYEKRRALRVALRGPEMVGRLRVSLPQSWSPASQTQNAVDPGDSVYVEEMPPGNAAGPGRHLAIRRLRTGSLHDELLSPIEYLFRVDLLSERDLPPAVPRGDSPVVQSIDIAGWPGKLVTQTLVTNSPRAPIKKSLTACATLPNSQAVVIKLTGDGQPDAADEELVRQMAETVVVKDTAPPEDCGGTVSVPGGIILNVPRGLAMLPNRDPSHTSRELVSSGTAMPWTGIELVPCTWLPGDGEETFLSLLAVRDRDWKPGPVTKIGPNLWTAERADNKSFPSRAYLRTNGAEQALLVILRGGYRDASSLDTAWQAMGSSIHFAPQRDLAESLGAGAEAVKQVQEEGIDHLVKPQVGPQSWLLWDQQENVDQRQWMQTMWNLGTAGKPSQAESGADDAPSIWVGRRQTLPPDPFGGSPEWLLEWSGSNDLRNYTARGSASGNRRAPGGMIPSQNIRVEATADRLKITQRDPEGFARPPQYVPGGWLPMLLWKLTDAGSPVILRTESFVGYDGLPLRSLLTLTVHRGGGGSMNCVTVEVNGSGQTTRWYYDVGPEQEGTLRYVDLTANLRLQQSDPFSDDRGGR